MKLYTAAQIAAGFAKLAKLYPASYTWILKLWFGYDLMLVRLVRPRVGDTEHDGITHKDNPEQLAIK